MRRLIALAAMFSIPACGCFEDAYKSFCMSNPHECDGGATGGGSATGGGTAPGGGAALGGGSETGGGAATGGGSQAPDALKVNLMTPVNPTACVLGQIDLTSNGNFTTFGSDITVTLDGGGLFFFYDVNDTLCVSGKNVFTIPMNQQLVSLRFSASQFGVATVTASSTSPVLSGQSILTSLAILGFANAVVLPPLQDSMCLKVEDIFATNSGGQTVTAFQDTFIPVDSNLTSSELNFGQDTSSCTTASPITLKMAAGQKSVSVYLQLNTGVTPGTPIILSLSGTPPAGTVYDPVLIKSTAYAKCSTPDGGHCNDASDCCGGVNCSGGFCQ
jgi:hypothetical protein